MDFPYFIKPIPLHMGTNQIAYLTAENALTVPPIELRRELLQAYVDFVHPFMPLLDLCEFVMIIESDANMLDQNISLILFQAIMFAGSAFVDWQHLENAGYQTREDAREELAKKTRVRLLLSPV